MSIAVMNLRIHPHTVNRYVDLFRAVYKLKLPAKVHGDRYGLMSTADFSMASDGVVSGVFTTFTRLETGGTWFDAANLQEASDAQVSRVSIPPGLFPNAAAYFFHFDAHDHRLYVESYSRGKALTPPSILHFLQRLFGQASIIEQFGEPSITMVQATAGLDALFSIDKINRIEIELLKPNADIFADDFEDEIEKHLLEAHGRKVTIAYEAESGQSLVATPSIRKVSRPALDNGEIRVKGRDKGVAVSRSSGEFPEVLNDRYDPDHTSEEQAFTRLLPKRKN